MGGLLGGSGQGSPFGFGILRSNGIVAQLLARLRGSPLPPGPGGNQPPPGNGGGLTLEVNGSTGPVTLDSSTGYVLNYTVTGGTPKDQVVFISNSSPSTSGASEIPLAGAHFDEFGDWSISYEATLGTTYFAIGDGSTISNWVEVTAS